MNIAEGDYLPIVRVAPIYPARALSRNLEGYCDMSFTVTPTGTTADPITEFCTSSLFDRSSQRAVLKFKYKPRVVDGVPQTVSGVKTRITFKIED
jgi:protein TonB